MAGLLIDNFAGGGGASFALMEAFGRKVDFAINHDPEALAMHEANHPETTHIQSDVFEVDPFEVCAGRSIDAAWFSPDCTHFSRAKGGKPRSKKIRALAWVVLKWASLPAHQRPRVIFLENVAEFETWGPLDDEGYPIKAREGETYTFWRKSLEKRGYVIEARKLRACDYGAPTIRQRLFMVMRCDGEPIRWPEITHKDPRKKRPPQVRVKLKPWRTAAECIDWSIPCPSIFERKKDLADNTCRRIARGIMRYVVENPTPFIVPLTHAGDSRFHPGNEPLRTITTANGGEMALVAPVFAPRYNDDRDGRQPRARSVDEPAATITGGGNAPGMLVSPFMSRVDMTSAAMRNGIAGLDEPLRTVTTAGPFAVVAPHITKFRGGATGHELDVPLATITANSFHKRPGGAPPLGLVVAHLNTNRNAEKPFNGADEPTHTITADGAHINLVSAFLSQFSGTTDAKINAGHPVGEPMSTIVGRGPLQALTAAHLLSLKGSDRRDGPMDVPAPTICAGGGHAAAVTAFLLKYYKTGAFASPIDDPAHSVTAKARFGLVVVMIQGEPYVIADIGMRMLSPRELFNAQGFASSYLIDLKVKGRKLPKSTQIRLVGNSVSPPPAIALAVANAPLMTRRWRHGEREIAIA